jgi:hypothetical protein
LSRRVANDDSPAQVVFERRLALVRMPLWGRRSRRQ